jgi:pimeloyl-ACP methyl ester carboxylesterase
MIRSILLLVLAALAAPAVAAPSPAAFTPAPCKFEGVKPGWAKKNHIECAWLQVRESRGKPDSQTIRLWVAIARADTAVKREDPILYINGGPGVATVDYVFPSFPKSKTWPAFRKDRDLVFFDQRGTGRSEPAFCPELDKTLEQVQQEAPPAREALDRSKAAYAACRPKMQAQGVDLANFNSTVTVEDAEDLRRALGIAQWNVYGISYGSLVGLEYLRRHPESLRSAIVDSVFPPNSAVGAEQVGTTASAYQAVQRACALDPGCNTRFPDVLGTLRQAVERLNTAPLPRAAGGRITGDTFRDIMWMMLVRTKTVPWVPLALERAAAGDEAVIRKLDDLFGGIDGGFGNISQGQSLASACYEIFGGSTAASRRVVRQRHPYLTAQDMIASQDDELCATWQPVRAPVEFHAPVRSEVPTLLYGGEFDPATPYDDAVLAAKNLSNGTLVYVKGASHASFTLDDCTRGIAHAFLDAPSKQPDLACLAQRKDTLFPTEGLMEFLASQGG